MKSRGWKHCPPSFISSNSKANEMKLQILDEGLDSNREGEVVSFFNELDTERRTMLIEFHFFRFNPKKTSLFHFLT
jgi:hypothetical protein